MQRYNFLNFLPQITYNFSISLHFKQDFFTHQTKMKQQKELISSLHISENITKEFITFINFLKKDLLKHCIYDKSGKMKFSFPLSTLCHTFLYQSLFI